MKHAIASTARTAELSHAEMVARGAYRVIAWLDRAGRAWAAHRRRMRDLDHLCQLDDRHLADIGLSRSDLTCEGLADAARRRTSAAGRIGGRT